MVAHYTCYIISFILFFYSHALTFGFGTQKKRLQISEAYCKGADVGDTLVWAYEEPNSTITFNLE